MTTNFYNVIITPTAYREISRIYEYITEVHICIMVVKLHR